MAKKGMAPWHDREATNWLASFQPWQRMLSEIRTTLEKEPRNHPHEIRAAACMVIMFGREGVWPVQGGIRELDSIVDLARRQLQIVRQMYALEGRHNKSLMANMNYKTLLKSLEEEIKILETRLSDEPTLTRNRPPCSWGNSLGKRSNRPDEV